MSRYGTESATRNGHDQRGRNALSANVAYAEVQFFVTDVEVVQVAAYLPGRHDRRRHIQVLTGREHGGNHRHLDAARDAQVALETLFGLVGLLELDLALDKRIQNKQKHHESEQL